LGDNAVGLTDMTNIHEHNCLLLCDVMYCARNVVTFQKNLLHHQVEDGGGSKFLWNVGTCTYIPDYTVPCSVRHYL